MPEAISTPNLVTLPITSQELSRSGFFCPPTKIGLSNNPTTIGLKSVKNINLIIKESSHRLIKKMQLFMGKTHPVHTHCNGMENLGYIVV